MEDMLNKIKNCTSINELYGLVDEITEFGNQEELEKGFIKRRAELSKKVATLKLIDYSDISVPMAVIYDKPIDFPNSVIIRIWDASINAAMEAYCEYSTVEQAMADAMESGFSTNLGRGTEDDPKIVCTLMK